MGMFTSVIRPRDGMELQIKCGWDDCETYHLGDEVKWNPIKTWPGAGKLFDGVYPSYSSDGPDDYVVIKNHKIHAIVPKNAYVSRDGAFIEIHLEERYCIETYKREWWPEEEWKQQEINSAKREKEAADYVEYLDTLTPAERLVASIFPRKRLDYNSLARTILNIQQLPEGAESIYYLKDKDESNNTK